MWQDTIVEEVRETRLEHAQEFDFDRSAIFADLKSQESKSARRIVKFAPKPALELAIAK